MPLPKKTKATLGPCILVPQVVVEGSTQGRKKAGELSWSDVPGLVNFSHLQWF